MEQISVLLIDDDDSFRKVLTIELEAMSFKTFSASSRVEALRILGERIIDVIILDIIIPDINGIDFLQEIKSSFPETEIIMLTAHGSIDSAIKSLKYGAYDYLTKPCKLDVLEAIVKKAYDKKFLRNQNLMLKEQIQRKIKFSNIIGKSRAIKNVIEMTGKVAKTKSTVLILGESGVGKEIFARAIYQNSPRKNNAFVVIDCSTLHENLLESELFGHEKGAYTSAVSLKHGLFEIANGGTLFLDEVAEIDISIQAKLLRVLETGTFRRLGGTKDLKVDVRLIAATNKDLKTLIENKVFRDDLYYRLNIFSITIPPLRERNEDIPLLVEHFLKNSQFSVNPTTKISNETLKILMDYSWPGNIRELENVIERAIILSENEITPKDLPRSIFQELHENILETEQEILTLKEIEGKYIQKILEYTGNNKLKAARLLGIDPKTLYRKLNTLKKH